jgi:hypothetical protein
MSSRRRLTTADLIGEEEDTHSRKVEPPEGAAKEADSEGRRARSTDSRQGAWTGNELERLLDDADSERYRVRWQELQIAFVDDPREAVAAADELVAELMRHLAKRFNQERVSLESQWSRGDDVSTEELRVSLQRYHSFFERLLAA